MLRKLAATAIFGVLLFSMVGCVNPFSPDADDNDDNGGRHHGRGGCDSVRVDDSVTVTDSTFLGKVN